MADEEVSNSINASKIQKMRNLRTIKTINEEDENSELTEAGDQEDPPDIDTDNQQSFINSEKLGEEEIKVEEHEIHETRRNKTDFASNSKAQRNRV